MLILIRRERFEIVSKQRRSIMSFTDEKRLTVAVCLSNN